MGPPLPPMSAAEPVASAAAPTPPASIAAPRKKPHPWSELQRFGFPPEGTPTRMAVQSCNSGVTSRKRRPYHILPRPGGIVVGADIRYNCADKVTFSHAAVQGKTLNIIVHTPRGSGPRARCMCETTVKVAARVKPGRYTVRFSQKGQGGLDFRRDVDVRAAP